MMYKIKLITLFIIFSGLGKSQSVENYNEKKISFEQKYFVVDSTVWEKGNKEFYKELQPVSDTLFQMLGLERQEPMMTYVELMDTIKKSSNSPENYKRYFIYETINDSIIKRYESTPEHTYASGPTYLNFKLGKVYGNYPYKDFHRVYEYEFENVKNVTIKEFRNQKKKIKDIECFKVEISYTKILEDLMDEEFPEFNSLLKNQEIQLKMWVTDKIKNIYHPVVKVKEINEKYYPLEIEMKSSGSEGVLYHYTLSELNF